MYIYIYIYVYVYVCALLVPKYFLRPTLLLAEPLLYKASTLVLVCLLY